MRESETIMGERWRWWESLALVGWFALLLPLIAWRGLCSLSGWRSDS